MTARHVLFPDCKPCIQTLHALLGQHKTELLLHVGAATRPVSVHVVTRDSRYVDSRLAMHSLSDTSSCVAGCRAARNITRGQPCFAAAAAPSCVCARNGSFRIASRATRARARLPSTCAAHPAAASAADMSTGSSSDCRDHPPGPGQNAATAEVGNEQQFMLTRAGHDQKQSYIQSYICLMHGLPPYSG